MNLAPRVPGVGHRQAGASGDDDFGRAPPPLRTW